MKHLLNKKDMKRLIIYSILSIAAIYTYGQSNFSKTDVKSIMKRGCRLADSQSGKGT